MKNKTQKIKIFAKALVSAGAEIGHFEELVADVMSVCTELYANEEALKLLSSKSLSFSDKKTLLKTMFGDFIGKETYNFLLVLIKNDELKNLKPIVTAAEKLHARHIGVLDVVVETAIKLDVKQIKKITEAIEEKFQQKIVAKNIVNKKLIGGILLRINDTEFDASVFGKIIRLKHKIYGE
jgi:F-type H+-transporting ATPase subunit delta